MYRCVRLYESGSGRWLDEALLWSAGLSRCLSPALTQAPPHVGSLAFVVENTRTMALVNYFDILLQCLTVLSCSSHISTPTTVPILITEPCLAVREPI